MFDFISSVFFFILIDYFIRLGSFVGFQNIKLALSCSW